MAFREIDKSYPSSLSRHTGSGLPVEYTTRQYADVSVFFLPHFCLAFSIHTSLLLNLTLVSGSRVV